MSVDRDGNRWKWGIALIVAIVLFVGSLIFTFITGMYSEWLPLYFCWGDMLLVGAIFIILLNLIAGGSLPDTTGWGESVVGGFLLAVTTFTLIALSPSVYSDTTEQMYSLGCFGVLGALVAFAFGAAFRRYSLLLVAGASFFLWNTFIPYEVIALSLTVVCLGLAVGFLYWLNRAYPPMVAEPENVKIEDILNDPDVAMAQLERMAQAELPDAADENELPEWLMEVETQQEDLIFEKPLPLDTFQEENLLDKSSPALFAIFVVLLIGFLFFLTFIAVFVR